MIDEDFMNEHIYVSLFNDSFISVLMTSPEVDANGFCTQQQTRLHHKKIHAPFLGYVHVRVRRVRGMDVAPVNLSSIELDVDTNPA